MRRKGADIEGLRGRELAIRAVDIGELRARAIWIHLWPPFWEGIILGYYRYHGHIRSLGVREFASVPYQAKVWRWERENSLGADKRAPADNSLGCISRVQSGRVRISIQAQFLLQRNHEAHGLCKHGPFYS